MVDQPGTLFDRKVSVQVVTTLITGLRVSFKAKRTSKVDPNTLELSIYNLSPITRAQVQKTHAPVILQAGYKTTAEIIFTGKIRKGGVSHVKHGADWITSIKIGDGETEFALARINQSFGPNTPLATMVQAIATATGLPIGNVMQKAQQGDLTGAFRGSINGFVATGKAIETLYRVMKSAGYDLSVQDGQLQALGPKESTLEPMIVLNPSSGLIGSPEPGDNRVIKARSLLQPGARPGRKVNLQSRSINGIYRVETATHTGDTHGAEWYSDLELKPLV